MTAVFRTVSYSGAFIFIAQGFCSDPDADPDQVIRIMKFYTLRRTRAFGGQWAALTPQPCFLLLIFKLLLSGFPDCAGPGQPLRQV